MKSSPFYFGSSNCVDPGWQLCSPRRGGGEEVPGLWPGTQGPGEVVWLGWTEVARCPPLFCSVPARKISPGGPTHPLRWERPGEGQKCGSRRRDEAGPLWSPSAAPTDDHHLLSTHPVPSMGISRPQEDRSVPEMAEQCHGLLHEGGYCTPSRHSFWQPCLVFEGQRSSVVQGQWHFYKQHRGVFEGPCIWWHWTWTLKFIELFSY